MKIQDSWFRTGIEDLVPREPGFRACFRAPAASTSWPGQCQVAVSDREGNFSEPLDLGAKVGSCFGLYCRPVGAVW